MRKLPVIAAALVLLLFGAAQARADTLADCGRFFLKYNPSTKKMECVGGKRKRARSRRPSRESLARDLQRSLQSLQGIVNQAERLLGGQDLTQDVERRVQELLTEARQRTRDIQRKSRELQQDQRTRQQELASEQRQATQAQVQLARALEQKQRALTQQLLAEQRSRLQEIQRRPVLGQ